MEIERRVIILSGEGSGSVTVTSIDEESKIKVSLFSLPYKRYYFLIKDDEVIEYEWEGTHTEILHKKRINCDRAHFIVSDGERAILYGTLNQSRLWQSNLPIRRKKIEKKVVEVAPPKADFSYSEVAVLPIVYDDGAIAEENYFERVMQDGKEASMSFSEEYRNYILSASEMSVGKYRNESESDSIIPGTEQIKERLRASGHGDAVFLVPSIDKQERLVTKGRKLTFYEEVKEQIDKLFSEGERVKELEQNLPFTRWVKVNFDRHYYVVGLIGNPPDYLCYGLPGRYSVHPPTELGEWCWWLPRDFRAPMEEGYWVLYQSLLTGESVREIPI